MDLTFEKFSNAQFGVVRVFTIDDEPYFVGSEVATILGYLKARNAIALHVDEGDSMKYDMADSQGVVHPTTLINESGLYSLIFASKLSTAKAFKKWVTSEVLPSIRKHGAYMTQQALDRALTDPDYLIQLATMVKEERAKAAELEKQRQVEQQKRI